jgi:hypothetical protein
VQDYLAKKTIPTSTVGISRNFYFYGKNEKKQTNK